MSPSQRSNNEDDFPNVQHLVNLVQEQARLIEQLRARGPVGFFQRRRLRKMGEAELMARYLMEDALRNQNLRLKTRIRELNDE